MVFALDGDSTIISEDTEFLNFGLLSGFQLESISKIFYLYLKYDFSKIFLKQFLNVFFLNPIF
ncbi:hypothetical protein LEP1GSC046_3576 [Leptospira kirschneri serovar Bim str. 1051]|nr:hypothetical protein LEP1GSC042_3790 [Leptospira kirschneri serovar Bim str. PUO 1247]EMN05156.1 hypothetical protein LEP1GSC046_3576 [Leptospira kirschneri serovar Bim str. 1051]